jgi:hypothetical protein
MKEEILQYTNLIQLLVLFTFVHAVMRLPKNRPNRILIAILFVCLVNEVISLIFAIKQINNGLLVSIAIAIHNTLWLLLLSHILKPKRRLNWLIALSLGFAVVNLFLFEGMTDFNYNTFILGALLYIMIYIYESFVQLNKESFSFFYSNHFILLSSPLLFFFGLSFIFGFRNYDLSITKIYGDIHLYAFIGSIVNLIYYLLLNVYIHRENKALHVQ